MYKQYACMQVDGVRYLEPSLLRQSLSQINEHRANAIGYQVCAVRSAAAMKSLSKGVDIFHKLTSACLEEDQGKPWFPPEMLHQYFIRLTQSGHPYSSTELS